MSLLYKCQQVYLQSQVSVRSLDIPNVLHNPKITGFNPSCGDLAADRHTLILTVLSTADHTVSNGKLLNIKPSKVFWTFLLILDKQIMPRKSLLVNYLQ